MELDANPGCFGLPTAVSATSVSCRACPARGGCVYEASVFLATLPNNPNITRERKAFALTQRVLASSPAVGAVGEAHPIVVASSRGLKRMPLTSAQLDCVSRFPARIGGQVRTLMERGWFDFAKTELRAGRNPASKGWKHVFCRQLLTGPVVRADLRFALMEELDLSPGSADVQTSTGIAIFAAGRLATERHGALALNPN